MNTSAFLKITGWTLCITGIFIACLSPIIFTKIIVPWLGWVFIVGEGNLHYDTAHTKILAVDNLGAAVVWWILISVIGCTVMFIGKKILAGYENPTLKENRVLCILLIVIVLLSILVCHPTS